MTIGIVKQATANPLDVSAGIRAALPEITEDLPDGMRLAMSYDTSIFIDRSIKAVYSTIAEAIVLVVLIIFFFLRSFRATLIPLVTIPVSLIGAFALMYALGFTVNTLTLLSMVLAIGLVVDDAIVVLENIHRHIEDGMEPNAAAIRGIKEIAFAVIAMTLTLVAVYAPMAFSTGPHGQAVHRVRADAGRRGAGLGLRRADADADDVRQAAASTRDKHGWLYNLLERGFDGLSRGYRASLARGLVGAPADRPAGALRCRRQLLLLHESALGTGPGRGSRHDHRHRRGAGGRDDGLHRRLCPPDRRLFQQRSRRSRATSSSSASRT